MKKQKVFYFLIFVFFLLLLKTDYRIASGVNCCGDDFDYYSHAQTLAIDFDFDYSNQIPNYSKFYYTNGSKIAPVGFSGSGILAAPFLFIGNILDEWFGLTNNLFNYKIITYSLSPLFYLSLSAILLQKSLDIINVSLSRFKVLLLISGSGVAYYALERYSMTHVYEVFINCMLIYCSILIFSDEKKNKLSTFFLPVVIVIGLLIKLSNFYILLVPLLVKELLKPFNLSLVPQKKNSLIFLSGSAIGGLIFWGINMLIYGKVIFNPSETYSAQSQVSGYLSSTNNLFDFFTEIIRTTLIVNFSSEFGALWFSPSIFLIFVFIVYFLIKKRFKIFFLTSLIYFFNIAIVNLWQSTASSYGFRYMYSLIPLGILIFYAVETQITAKIIRYYLLPFSVFGLFSVFMFESTEFVQLSTIDVVNSFGKTIRYSQPDYLIGIFKSLFVLDGYLKLFATSFLGMLLFKFFVVLFGINNFYNTLTFLNLPLDNPDFLILVENLQAINIIQMLGFMLIVAGIIYILSRSAAKLHTNNHD